MVDKTSKNLNEKFTNNKVVEYQSALLRQRDMEADSLQVQINKLEGENLNIANSLSYKIGMFITFPFRMLIKWFSPELTTVLNPIKATCDSATYTLGVLEVVGWALSESKISKAEVFLNDKHIGNAQLGVFREDVMQAFPDVNNSQFSGFSLIVPLVIEGGFIELKIYDEQGFCVALSKQAIPEVGNLSLNTQYKIFLQQQKPSKLINISFDYQPLISIIVPVFNVEPKWLNLCINSVVNQLYQNWQLCLYDDGSSNQETVDCLVAWEGKDNRVHINFGKTNRGISVASNNAIKVATGDFIALLNHDDELAPDALLQVINVLNDDKNHDFIYSDEDKIDDMGNCCDPHFKSDFNLDTLLSWNYICHFAVIRKSIGDKIGWFRQGFEGSQDYDLFLRLVANTSNIYHISRVLYHWRKISGSTVLAINNKSNVLSSTLKALASYQKQQHIDATIEPGLFANSNRLKRATKQQKQVSIIIPFKDEYQLLKACVESILNKTAYKNYDIVLVDNQSKNSLVVDYCKSLASIHKNIRMLKFDEIFNFSKLNNWAVTQIEDEYVLFLNNDTEVINAEWLTSMVEHIQRPEVGAVGAKLLYLDNTIQHSGIVVSSVGAVHVNKGTLDNDDEYFQRANYVQNISACTAACLLVNKSVFIGVGGFDEKLFKIAYNDVDLCLKIRQKGYKIVYTPYAKLYHYESRSRGFDDNPEKIARFAQELKNYQMKWGEVYKKGDPYYNLNLKQNSEKVCLNID